MYLGVDYYPEHWDKFMIDEDLQRIKRTGANTIRIGEFAWHMMEPEEGKFDFSYFDFVIEKAKEYGFYIIFGTPTATFPAWLAKKYPTILSKDEKGATRSFGGRRQYCFNSDEYLDYSLKIANKLVDHYKNEESIIAWQIDNEFGHEGSDMCFCETCHEKFQVFLKNKYGHIDTLNKSYGTVFWGQTYNTFKEIPIPIMTITTHNPTLQLDWARFRSYSINSFAVTHIDLVNKLKRKDQQVTHNFFGGFFNLSYDLNVMSEKLDVVSYDNYPVWGGLDKPISVANIAMTHDYIRGLKGKNYWILEELMGAQGHTEIGYLPRPNQAKLWAYQAMAKGCESLLFFRWRTMTHGAEQFCQGILDVDNCDNRKLEEVTDFFSEVLEHEDILKSEISSDVAILYDFDNRWSWKFQPQSFGFEYTEEILRVYEAFHNLNVNMDVVSVHKDFSKYKIIVLPVMQIIDKDMEEKLKDFAISGGKIIFTFRSGIKDRNNNLVLGYKAPNRIKDLCGIEIEEYESLGLKGKVLIKGNDSNEPKQYEVTVWRDLIKTTTAKSIFNYVDDIYSDYAAITENKFGEGMVYYIGCGIEPSCTQVIVSRILEDSNVFYEETKENVEVIYRENKNKKLKFILNHNGCMSEYDGILLKPYETIIKDLD